MALLSQMDWIILLGVGGFLLLGQGNGATLRQMGRWYGRLARLKQELLSEFTRSADLPVPTPGRPFSLRQAFLETDLPGGQVSGIPAAVSRAPALVAAVSTPTSFVPAYLGEESWSLARPIPGLEGRP